MKMDRTEPLAKRLRYAAEINVGNRIRENLCLEAAGALERLAADKVELVVGLREIHDGSEHEGRWLDEDGNECDEHDEGARWCRFTADEQAAWLDSVAATARTLLDKHAAPEA
jgi:hypothetical protein